jgi:hypothetical protein
VKVIALLFLLSLASHVALPSAAWAHDCPEELEACLRMSLGGPLGLIGAALLMAGAAMAERRRREQEQREWDEGLANVRKAGGYGPHQRQSSWGPFRRAGRWRK